VKSDKEVAALKHKVMSIFSDLARQIIHDGEGVTKPFSVSVYQGATVEECMLIARTVSGSPLVKTAVHARDPNWGRILAAIGRAGLDGLDIQEVRVLLGDTLVVDKGALYSKYKEAQGYEAMNAKELDIAIYLGRGKADARILSADLSAEYVRINCNYRS
jgi:glutamate N-acetyltransferase/amino-acid N-acetyltransferase